VDLVGRFVSTYGKPQTRRSYRSDLRQFFGGEEVLRQEASRTQKDDFIEFLRERVDSLKRTSLERKIETVRSFFRWIAEQDLIEELPIKEEVNTGDLIDQVLQEARKTTEGEGHSPRAEEPEGEDGGDSGGSRRGPVPMELEPGSEVDLDRETDSDSEKSSSPGSRPELREGAEDTPDSEHTESPLSEASPSEEPQSRESSNDTFTGSDPDSAKKGPPKEKSVEDRDTREEPIGERGTEDNSTDDDSTGENSDGKDRPSIPDWALASGDAKEIDLHRGEKVALEKLSDVLRGALPQLRDPSGPEGLFIRCTSDLKVQIRRHLDHNSQIIEASIEHCVLQRILRNEGDLAERHALRQAILYLHDLNWTLPPAVYDLIDALPNPDDADGSFSEECPRWRREGTGGRMGDAFLAVQITGVLAEGFGIEKDEEVLVGI
jgi:hypothetical protein